MQYSLYVRGMIQICKENVNIIETEAAKEIRVTFVKLCVSRIK